MRPSLVLLVVAVGCAEVDPPQPPELLPEDYGTRFVEVVSCRASLAHGSNLVVRIAPELEGAYRAGPYPLPAGALIVAEEYTDDASCGLPSGYSVMRKQASGYDTAGADWKWMRLDRMQRVVEQGNLASCGRCHGGGGADCPAGRTRDRTCAER